MSEKSDQPILAYSPPERRSELGRLKEFFRPNWMVWLVAIVLTILVCSIHGEWSWGHFSSRWWLYIQIDGGIRFGYKPNMTDLGRMAANALRVFVVLFFMAIGSVVSWRIRRWQMPRVASGRFSGRALK